MATQTGTKRHLGITSDTVVTNSDITVGGNLTVEGTTTTLDTANLLVEDKNIIIGNVSTPTDTTADGGGITLKGASDYTINWSNTNNRWDFNQGIHSTGNVTGANLSGTNTGDNSANTHSSLFIDRGSIDVTTTTGGSNANPFDDAHTETKVAENGMRTLTYTGASAFMYTFNNGGSASVVQIGAHYNGNDYYLRTRTDSSNWQTWKKIRTFGNTTLPTDFVSAASGGTFSGNIAASNLSGTNTGDQVLPTDFISAANGGTFSGNIAASNLSGTNTGDQDLSGYALTNHNHNSSYLQKVYTNNWTRVGYGNNGSTAYHKLATITVTAAYTNYNATFDWTGRYASGTAGIHIHSDNDTTADVFGAWYEDFNPTKTLEDTNGWIKYTQSGSVVEIWVKTIGWREFDYIRKDSVTEGTPTIVWYTESTTTDQATEPSNLNAFTNRTHTEAGYSTATGVANNAEVNVQSDWNATSGDAFIQNKPAIPTDYGDHDGLYVPVGGGTIDSGTSTSLIIDHDTFANGLILKRNHASNAASIVFKNTTGQQGVLFAISSDNLPYWRKGTDTSTNYRVWTSDDFASSTVSGALQKSGGTMTGALGMGNFNITGVNALSFNDPGPNEGISWTGGNMKIYESPDDLTTNSAGNLQFVYGTTRRLTVNNSGIYVNGSISISGESLTNTNVQDFKATATNYKTANNRKYNISLSNFTGKRYYRLASVNTGSGGLRIRGLLTNHVESFGSSKVDISIQGRRLNSGNEIEINGNVNAFHEGSGILVVEGDTSDVNYDRYDVYLVASQYQQVDLDLQFHSATMRLETTYTATLPVGADGMVHLDTSLLNEGTYTIENKIITRDENIREHIPNKNLLRQDSIQIQNRTDIAGNASYTNYGKYKRRYANDNTGDSNIRLYCDLTDLVDGEYYMVSIYYENLKGTLSMDWCDEDLIGKSSVVSSATDSATSRGRLYGYSKKADYTSTYRFMDVILSQGSGNQVTLYHPKVEEGMLLSPFTFTHDNYVDFDKQVSTLIATDKIATREIDITDPDNIFRVTSNGDSLLQMYGDGTFSIGDVDEANDSSYIENEGDRIVHYVESNDILQLGRADATISGDTFNVYGLYTHHGGARNWNTTTPGTTKGSIHLDPGITTDHYGSAITFGASDSSNGTTAQAGIYTRSDGSYGTKMYFATTDSYSSGSKIRMSISHQGMVAIGASPNANYRLWTNGATYTESLNVGASASTGSISAFVYSTAPYITTTSGKSVNIGGGPGNNQNNLAVRNGNIRVYSGAIGCNVAPSTTDGRIDAGNDIVAYSSSDRRWKENIMPIGNALEKLSKIRGVSFDWKELSEEEKKSQHSNVGHDIGVIAQEVEAVLPEIVTTRENGYKGVRYEKIVPLLIESIKELQSEINELKKQIK